ncbi:MAG: DUF2877 domain-containing protein [bacterium]
MKTRPAPGAASAGEGGALFRFPLVRLGAAAAEMLGTAARPFRGRVLAVFRRSFYLEGEGEGGGLACLGPPSIGAGPLNAICDLPEGIDWEASGLAAGAPAHGEGECIRVGGRFLFSLEGVEDWRPDPLPAGWDASGLARGLAALAARARREAPAEGLGRMVPALAAGEAPEAAGGEAPLLARAAPAAALLMGWLAPAMAAGESGEALPLPPTWAAGLIGLGPGLTPSGDDFVGGALIALRALGFGTAADRLAAWALSIAGVGTGRISRAHLACAARGEGAAALHETLAALLGPHPDAALAAPLRNLDAIGHTSGWDALAGAAAVLALRARRS